MRNVKLKTVGWTVARLGRLKRSDCSDASVPLLVGIVSLSYCDPLAEAVGVSYGVVCFFYHRQGQFLVYFLVGFPSHRFHHFFLHPSVYDVLRYNIYASWAEIFKKSIYCGSRKGLRLGADESSSNFRVIHDAFVVVEQAAKPCWQHTLICPFSPYFMRETKSYSLGLIVPS
jgi:hypothetical protein